MPTRVVTLSLFVTMHYRCRCYYFSPWTGRHDN